MTAEIERRCVRMLAHLYHAPGTEASGGGGGGGGVASGAPAAAGSGSGSGSAGTSAAPKPVEAHSSEGVVGVGTSCLGSSEGCLLGGYAMKQRWRNRRRAAGLPDDKPNIVLSAAAQIIWHKFPMLADVEARFIPLQEGRYTVTPRDVVDRVDDHTIGVMMLFASTLTGEYDPVKEVAAALQEVNDRNGWDVGIHVDAASGGFVAPFVQPALQWDFRLPQVHSINVSGHKCVACVCVRNRHGVGVGTTPVTWQCLRRLHGLQVWSRVSGHRVRAVEEHGPAAPGAGVPRQLPGKRRAHLRSQLQPIGGAHHR